MNLLFPLGLAALAAWLLPLLIHLARRHPYTPLDFAALRWLRAQVRPRQRIRFDDWPLLLVRLLLLAALAVLLARPALTGPVPAAPAWTVVAPGLDALALRGEPADEQNWHWLATGFPGIEAPQPAQSATLPSLLRELDAQLPAGTALVVHVPDPLPGLDGQRLLLSRPVQWHVHAQAPPTATPDANAPLLRLQSDPPLPAQRWLAAVQRAWNGQTLAPRLAADALPDTGQIGVWTGTQPMPAHWQRWLQQGGQVLSSNTAPASAQILLRDAQGAPLLLQQPVGRGRVLHLAGEWNAATNLALHDPALPRQLQLALQGMPSARLGDAADHAPVQTALPQAGPRPVRELASWLIVLIVLIVLLFALERWLATAAWRRQPA